jgi:hypothetical protein
MIKLKAKFNIEFTEPGNENTFFEDVFREIIHKYSSFTFDIKYILIETMFTHRLLKKKHEYLYENLRKKLEDNQEIVIVETDLNHDPKIKNVPIIKDIEFYKALMKNFNGYVCFKYQGPINQIKQCIEYLNSLKYCDFCTFNMIYEINLYTIDPSTLNIHTMDSSKKELEDKPVNFLYVKVLTA